MNEIIDEKRRKRLEYMKALYEAADGRRNIRIDMIQLGRKLGLSRDDTEAIVDYLKGEGLITHNALDRFISLAHAGIVEVEAAVLKPTEATAHFPAVQNIITIHSMTNSAIQQGSSSSSQSFELSSAAIESLDRFTRAFKDHADQLKLEPDEKAEVEAEIATVEAELKSPKPKATMVATSIRFLAGIPEKAGSSFLESEIKAALPAVLAWLTNLHHI